MNVNSNFRLACMVAAGLVMFGCTKKTDNGKANYSDAAYSSSSVDNILKEVNRGITQAAADNNISGKTDGLNGTASTCATATLTPADFTTFPKTVVVDYGSGCTDDYGTTRKGQLTAVFSGYLNHGGSNVVVTFQNYYVNGVHVEGNYSLTNTNTLNSTSTPYRFTDSITNAKATTPEGTYCTWSGTRSSVQTSGTATPLQWTDDIYTVQGHSSGVGFSGSNFTATSTNVIYNLSCRYLTSGTVSILSGSDPTPIVVDFGNGACDNGYKASYGIYSTTLQFWY